MSTPSPEFVAGWQAAAAAVECAMKDVYGSLDPHMPLYIAANIDQALTEGLMDLGWRPEEST